MWISECLWKNGINLNWYDNTHITHPKWLSLTVVAASLASAELKIHCFIGASPGTKYWGALGWHKHSFSNGQTDKTHKKHWISINIWVLYPIRHMFIQFYWYWINSIKWLVVVEAATMDDDNNKNDHWRVYCVIKYLTLHNRYDFIADWGVDFNTPNSFERVSFNWGHA